MTFVCLYHYLPQFLSLETDMPPLQGHYIHNSKTASVERKEEHFQKLFSTRFRTGLIIFQQGKHLFLIQTLPVKFAFFV